MWSQSIKTRVYARTEPGNGAQVSIWGKREDSPKCWKGRGRELQGIPMLLAPWGHVGERHLRSLRTEPMSRAGRGRDNVCRACQQAGAGKLGQSLQERGEGRFSGVDARRSRGVRGEHSVHRAHMGPRAQPGPSPRAALRADANPVGP